MKKNPTICARCQQPERPAGQYGTTTMVGIDTQRYHVECFGPALNGVLAPLVHASVITPARKARTRP